MKRKSFIVVIFAILATILLSGCLGEEGTTYNNPYYSDDVLQKYKDSLPTTILEKYSVEDEYFSKLAVDLSIDFSTSEMTDFIIILDEEPANVTYSKNKTISLSELENNVKKTVNDFYSNMNISVSGNSGQGYLGMADNYYDSVDIYVDNVYSNALVGISAKMPAEYLYYLIGLDEVAYVYMDSIIQVNPVTDTILPDYIVNEINANMYNSNEYLNLDSIHNGTWGENVDGFTGKGINVAVMDSGFDWTHPDLLETTAGYKENLALNEQGLKDDFTYEKIVGDGWQKADDSWLRGWGHKDFIQNDFNPQEATPFDFQLDMEKYGETGENPPCSTLQEFYVTGHGTHVAGTIASQGKVENINGTTQSVKGVAPDANIFGIRVLGSCGGGRASQFAEGMDYVAGFTFQDLIDDTNANSNTANFIWEDYVQEQIALGVPESKYYDANGDLIEERKKDLVIDVINMSLGGGQSMPSDPVNLAVHRLADLGVVVVAAAGNAGAFGTYSVHAPGSADKIITVGAAKTDIYIENVELTYAGTDRVINAFAFKKGNLEELANVALNNKEMIYAGFGREADYKDSANGKVVLVDRGRTSFYQKFLVAKAKGASAVIIINYDGTGTDDINEYYGELSAFSIPIFAVNNSIGVQMKSTISTGNKITVNKVNHEQNDKVILENNTVADFSSLGPNYGSLNIKPDVIAPGVDVVATIPDFYEISQGEPYREDNYSYGKMSGTSMATPHVAGIAALLVQKYKFEMNVWDEMPLEFRGQTLKVVLMNTADHTVYSGYEYDPVLEELGSYSVFKRSTGLVSPIRALHYLDKASIYSLYDQKYLYIDNSQTGTTNEVGTINTSGIKTGLLNYGLLIGNDTNDVSLINSAFTDDIWRDRKVTIDNTICSQDDTNSVSPKYYKVEYMNNNSKYSKVTQLNQIKFTVSNMLYKDIDGTEISSNDIDQSIFEAGHYFINGNDGMYVEVPCGQKVELQIEMAYMHSNLDVGQYEGYFNFKEVIESEASNAYPLYDPLQYAYGSETNVSKKFLDAKYEYGNKDELNPDNVVFSLPFAFKYVRPGVDFSFDFPFVAVGTNRVTFLKAELYSDIEEPVRLFVRKALQDEDGDYIDENGNKVQLDLSGAPVNPEDIQTEYVGVLDSHKFKDGFYKGLQFTVSPFTGMYTGDNCSVFYPNDNPETGEYDLGLEVKLDNMPEGCQRKGLTEGLYELEYRYKIKGTDIVEVKRGNWTLGTKEGAEISFVELEEQGQNKTYSIPGIYDFDAKDDSYFDENDEIWIEGRVFDSKIELMKSLSRDTFLKYKIDQSKNSLFIHLNGSLFPNFKSELDELGNFRIGINKKDIEGGGITLDFKAENILGIGNYPYQPFFAFLDKTSAHYRYVRLDSNKTINTEQEIELYAHNFNRVVEGGFGLNLNSTCDIQSITPSDELQQILDNNGQRIRINYTVATNSKTSYVSWEILGENVSGLSFTNDSMKMFDIKLTSVCESKFGLLNENGLRVAEIDKTFKYELIDVLGKSSYIMAFDATALDKENGLIPEGLFIKHDISGVNLQYLNHTAGVNQIKLIAPSGNVYYGNDKIVYFNTVEGNGEYYLEVKAPGYLTSNRIIDIEFANEGVPQVINLSTGYGVSGTFGDFNGDDVIDVRDAYYLLMLDDSKDAFTVHQAFLSTPLSFRSTFDAIVQNYGSVSSGIINAEILDEYGGFTMYDIAIKLGFGEYYDNYRFPDFDYVKIDTTSSPDKFISDCTIPTNPHPFFRQDFIIDAIDGSANDDGYKDGIIDSCELSKITHITIPEYMNTNFISSTEFDYMINLVEYNNIGGSVFSQLSRLSELEKIQIDGQGMFGTYNTSVFMYKENLKTIIARDINFSGQLFVHSNVLETVDLSNNRLISLEGLRNLTNVKYLYLANNSIMDLDGIQNLQNLEVLDLSGNKLQNIDELSNLKNLKYLILDDNQIEDISALKNLNLTLLSAKGNKIKSIDSLENMDLLQTLNLAENEITDISVLETVTNLKQLYLQDNKISNISSIQYTNSLFELNLLRNEILFINGSEAQITIDNLNDIAVKGLNVNYLQQKPIIHLHNSVVYIAVGDTYIDDEGSIFAFGGKLAVNSWEKYVVVIGLDELDTNTIGEYELSYYIVINGLKSNIVTRTVYVVDENFNSEIGTAIIQ